MKISRVRDLVPDSKNANKGTERGSGMLEHSLRTYGAGRSVLVDKKGRIIAGNKTVESAAAMGMDKVEVVQTDGRTLVVVQRTDLDLETDAKAKELAIADNRIAEVNLDWDGKALEALFAEGVNLDKLFGEAELKKILGEHLEEGDFKCCPECGRKYPKNRSRVAVKKEAEAAAQGVAR